MVSLLGDCAALLTSFKLSTVQGPSHAGFEARLARPRCGPRPRRQESDRRGASRLAPGAHRAERVPGDFDAAGGRSQFDRVSQPHRQLGSAFKPVVYAAAFEAGLATPTTLLDDSPIVVRSGSAGEDPVAAAHRGRRAF